ncbi:hypothetical protein CEB3_c37080 [Peptococcaceae bacterium CEB3]|nr:hypothetical protein CEB3_c37080 [Peptococcaceae bacterium CEB3]
MSKQVTLLKIYAGKDALWKGKHLYQALLFLLKDAGLAGVTVSRGIEGFGQRKAVHAARLLDLSADLPMVIECVDFSDNIEAVLPEIQVMVPKGLILTTDVLVHNEQLLSVGLGDTMEEECHVAEL